MKKNGRKWRKIQAEKEARKANTKSGEPFSKARNKKLICYHHSRCFGRCFIYSKLKIINKNECMCTQCHKIFSIDKYEQMKEFLAFIVHISHLINHSGVGEKEIKLYQGLEPVYYRNIDVGVTEILEVETKFMLGI